MSEYVQLNKAERIGLRAITKSMYDFQDIRKRVDARLEKKADGTFMKDNGTESQMDPEAYSLLEDYSVDTRNKELEFFAKLEERVKESPEWKYFLEGVKGCGPTMAAVLISEIDIEKATTMSKIWQYAGMNNGLVRGKKKNSKGEIIETEDMIQGDRLTAGYLCPYNKYLKTKMLGVLADCFIKCNSPYRFYYEWRKHRTANSSKEYKDGRPWSEETKAHIHNDAIRYMMKMFLRDYYFAVRNIYGLPTRVDYAEEYLGRKHHDSSQTYGFQGFLDTTRPEVEGNKEESEYLENLVNTFLVVKPKKEKKAKKEKKGGKKK